MADQLENCIAQLELLVQNLTNQNTNLTNEVAALNAAAAAAPAAVAPVGVVPPVAPAPVIFAENPGRYDVEHPIDFTTRLGANVYDRAIKPLPKLFNMKPNQTVVFSQSVVDRCTEIGLSVGTKNITKFINGTGTSIDLITQYDQITMAEIQAQCDRFILPGGADINMQVAQNNNMMAIFLMASLTKEATARLTPYRNKYTINGKIVGPLLYKVIMRQATIVGTCGAVSSRRI
jgi:hypothetical protein